ncbi:hypothetical protein Bca52824_024958 [Brassica carinata]|uniref:Uncharacterized protein n=1 Tax=Brassica carinata TaxID=52824 RepID=A0A8X7VLE8_BRACI|nr:hypothetical protein Bca52824_024958 [Brassica carinata]
MVVADDTHGGEEMGSPPKGYRSGGRGSGKLKKSNSSHYRSWSQGRTVDEERGEIRGRREQEESKRPHRCGKRR